MSEKLLAADLGEFNARGWANGDYVADYSTRTILPAEAVLLAAFRGSLNGPVLELGPGAGRLTRILVSLLADVTAIDVSPRMVAACRRNVPQARVEVGDIRDLRAFGDRAFRSIIGSNNIVDAVAHEERQALLAEFSRLLTPGGMLLFSSHNQANIPHLDTRLGSFARGALSSPRDFARTVYYGARLLKRVRNRRVAQTFENQTDTWAVINDPVHEHNFAQYYIRRDEQERQLAAAGFELEACFDRDGRPVPRGELAEFSPELHYAARLRTSSAN